MRGLPLLNILPCILVSAVCFCVDAPEAASDKPESSIITVTIVYDNNSWDPRLKTDWGFGCVIIGTEKTILFDTGGKGDLLLANMKALAISPSDIDVIVLSHIHSDHIGGLSAVLAENANVSVYIPKSFPNKIRHLVKAAGADVIDVSHPENICRDVYSVGEMGTWIKEQSLFIVGKTGISVITGCAHPGILNISRRASELAKMRVELVAGGFHLGGASDNEIESVIKGLKNLGVSRAAPCHCSGDRARALFERAFPRGYIGAGVGTILQVESKIRED